MSTDNSHDPETTQSYRLRGRYNFFDFVHQMYIKMHFTDVSACLLPSSVTLRLFHSDKCIYFLL